MNKEQKLREWISVNDQKYPSRHEWREALIKFVVKELNYLDITFTSKCWCGNSNPCDGKNHHEFLVKKLDQNVNSNRSLITKLYVILALQGLIALMMAIIYIFFF